MKIKGVFGLGVALSVVLLQPAQGRPVGGGRSFSAGHHFSGSAGHFSGASRNYSGGYGRYGRYYRSSPRYYSGAAHRRGTYYSARSRGAVNRATALNPRAYTASGPQVAAARKAVLRSQGFDSQGRVLAQSSRNWNRNQDHNWHGHRCHWHNNAWVIIDPWFYPWSFYPWDYGYYGYGYPYDAYAYGDPRYYEAVYEPNQYSENDDGYGDPQVSQVQAALSRKGYYRGAIDGSFGPVTRNALRQYQLNHGLEATGRIDRPVVEKLGVR